MVIPRFSRATKSQSRLRLALAGPGGSGKTYTALVVARELAGPDGRVAVIDSERGSASKYADVFTFDVLELTSFSPETYVAAIAAAEEAGYAVVVIDSLSHAWSGRDGALEQVDKVVARNEAQNRRANSFTAWREVTPMHNRLVDAMLQSRCHVVATLRVKTEYVTDPDEKGRMAPRKIGLAPIQRDGLEYEFDVMGDLTIDNKLAIGKTRCSALRGAVFDRPGPEFAAVLRAWLTDGAPLPAPEPKACVEVPPTAARPADIPERRQLRDRIAAWSQAAGDDFRAACEAVMRRAGVAVPPEGSRLDDAQVLATLAWVSDHEREPFAAATAEPSAERRQWAQPPKVTRHTVWYWREQLIRSATAWAQENAQAAAGTSVGVLVAQLERRLGLPEPGSCAERKAAAIYAAACGTAANWLECCVPF